IGTGQGPGLGPEQLGVPDGASSVTLTLPELPPDLGGTSQPFDNYQPSRSEEHTSELQSLTNLVCRLLLEKKKKTKAAQHTAPNSNTNASQSMHEQQDTKHPLQYTLDSATCASASPQLHTPYTSCSDAQLF